MNKDVPNAVMNYARSQEYAGAEYRCDWNGYKVYEPIDEEEDSGEVMCVGLPLKILAKGTEIRLSDPEETFQILDYLAEKD